MTAQEQQWAGRVGVVGGGLMGAGIAETCAAAGLEVTVREASEPLVGAARERLAAGVERAVTRGRLQREAARLLLERVSVTSDWDALGGCALVVEAVPEDVQLKAEVVAAVEGVVTADALVASNTSSIPIARLAAAAMSPERIVGLHFFSPVRAMALVEVVPALGTSARTVHVACAFARRIAKQPIVAGDRSGFIVNRLLVPYVAAAVRMLEEGFASAEDIDAGMRGGCGHPMGPLELADRIGLDVVLAACESLYEEFRREEYAPPPLLRRMVTAGRLGTKTGAGLRCGEAADALSAASTA